MVHRVEFLPLGLDGLDTFLLQDRLELSVDQSYPLDPRQLVEVIGHGLERPLEIVENWKETGEQNRVGGLRQIFLFLSHQLAVVGKIRRSPTPLVEVLVRFGLSLLEFRLQFLDAGLGLLLLPLHFLFLLFLFLQLLFSHSSRPPAVVIEILRCTGSASTGS